MNKLILNTIIAFLIISIIWLIYYLFKHFQVDAEISKSALLGFTKSSILKGFLLSVPFGVWKYVQDRNKEQA